MKKFLFVALFGLPCLMGGAPLANTVRATDFQAPQQKIEGADEPIPFGEVVILHPTPVAKPPQYLHTISYQWKVLVDGQEKKRGVKTFADGSIVFGGTPDQKITAILTISYLYIVREGDKPDGAVKEVSQKQSDILVANVVIKSSTPTPPTPTPGPNPQPTPPAPVNKFGLSDTVKGWLSTVGLSGQKKADTVSQMAQVFASLAADVTAGKINNQNDLVKQTQVKTAAVLKNGALQAAWETWATNLNTELSNLLKAGKISNIADWAQAYSEVAAGLTK